MEASISRSLGKDERKRQVWEESVLQARIEWALEEMREKGEDMSRWKWFQRACHACHTVEPFANKCQWRCCFPWAATPQSSCNYQHVAALNASHRAWQRLIPFPRARPPPSGFSSARRRQPVRIRQSDTPEGSRPDPVNPHTSITRQNFAPTACLNRDVPSRTGPCADPFPL